MKLEPLDNWAPKGDGLAALLAAADVFVVCPDDGKFYSNNAVLVAEITAAFDAVAHERALAQARVNQLAYDRIVAIMPPYKQNNNMALGLQNTMTYGADPSKWPADQQAILQVVNTQWAHIAAIREASNTINAALTAETDWLALVAFDPANDPRWPK